MLPACENENEGEAKARYAREGKRLAEAQSARHRTKVATIARAGQGSRRRAPACERFDALEISLRFQHDSRIIVAGKNASLVCLALALSTSACSRCASEPAPAPAGEEPRATTSVRAPEPVPKPLPPLVTPAVPSQLVACGERDFYRITQSLLEAFEIAEKPPPPEIRGSRVARKVAELAIDRPSNVFSPAKKSVLVIANGGLFRYELGQASTKRSAPISAKGPLVAWSDPRATLSFRVYVAGAEKLEEYGLPNGEAESPTEPAKKPRKVFSLPGFDARLFTVLADGTPLYSTAEGLVRGGDESRPVPFSQPSVPGTLLFADPSPERFWSSDASGKLALFDRKQGASPTFTTNVPGVVLDTALDGERVGVLSLEVVEQSYRPTVTVFSNGKEQARLPLGPSFGAREQPVLDLCLVAGRPWVVVGGRRWLQLLDWETRRLLAEW